MHKQFVRFARKRVCSRYIHVVASEREVKQRVAEEGPVGEGAGLKTAVADIQIKLAILCGAGGEIVEGDIGAGVIDQEVIRIGVETDRHGGAETAGFQ